MQLFGTLHLSLIAVILAFAAILSVLIRSGRISGRPVRLLLGSALIANELVWWVFRYSHEGFRFPHNMPLQLCDVTLWLTAIACLTLARPTVEFAYFAGLGGAGMAVLTPDLWSPWPTYPAIYFFIAHGGIIAGVAALVFGRISPLRRGCVWRAFGLLAAYAGFIGTFNAIFGTNYMYLCRKPASASLLDALGPWPMYIAGGAVVALAVFWLLWIPVKLTGSDAASPPRIELRASSAGRES